MVINVFSICSLWFCYILFSFLYIFDGYVHVDKKEHTEPKNKHNAWTTNKTIAIDDDEKIRLVCRICKGTGIVTGNKHVCVRRLPDVDVERDCYFCDYIRICRDEIEKKCPACEEKKFLIFDTGIWGTLEELRSDLHA